MTGRRLAHFELLEKLGEGGMGIVFKARDLHLDRPAAIKLLHPDKLADPARKSRFIQEAKAASALNHPNIVTIYDIRSGDGQDFIAMEFVDGTPLDELIARKMRFSEALRYAIQIADALAAAHAAGIVHRDLKPANVMITRSGLVKILDFGLAKLVEPAAPASTDTTRTARPLTEEGVIAGSAPYMSPEQAEGKPVDHRSDIFAFGALFYEMLTGQRAFQGESRMATLAAILTKDPAPLSEISPSLPKEIERIVMRCLRKELRRRSQSMAEIKIALEEVQYDSDSGASASRVAARRRRLLWWPAAGAAIIVLAVAVWMALPRPRGPRDPLRIVPLTTFPGQEGNPTMSPDGNQFAFTWDGGQPGPPRIFLSLTGTVNPLLLTKEEGPAARPAWSPDGQHIAFFRFDPVTGERTIHVIPALGGPERKIGETSTIGPLSWFPDSKRLCIGDNVEAGRIRSALFVISLDGARRQLTTPPEGDYVGDHAPAVSPDGSKVAFVRVLAEYVREIMLLNLTPDGERDGQSVRITHQNGNAQAPVWTPDGEQIVYLLGDPTDQRTVYRVRPDGSAPRPFPQLPREAEEIAFPRTGPRMIFRSATFDHNLWYADLSQPGAIPAQFASSTRWESSPAFSPDGKRIAFSSNRGGSRQIWIADADGGNAIALTSFSQGVVGSPRWSPDGQSIAFDARPDGNVDVYVVRAEGGQPRRLTDDPASDSVPSWSPDGRYIYFCSNRGNRRQLYRMPAGGGAQTQFTKNGGFVSQPSPDGQWIYYTVADRGLWRVASSGGEESQVLDNVHDFGFAVTSRGVYVVTGPVLNDKEPRMEWTVKLLAPGSAPKPVFAISRPFGLNITVSPDDRRLAWSQTDSQSADLMLVENFR